jgi:hypothetical protein
MKKTVAGILMTLDSVVESPETWHTLETGVMALTDVPARPRSVDE